MAEYGISAESFLGDYCYGEAEYVDADGTVELSDDDVRKLVDLIRKNGGETDVKALNLKGLYPDIYNTLAAAYRKISYEAQRRYWIEKNFEDRDSMEPEGLMERLEDEGLFHYEEDLDAIREENGLDADEEPDEYALEDAKTDAFHEWLDEYLADLSFEEKIDFFSDYYNWYIPGDVNLDESRCGCEVLIPEEIIRLANLNSIKKENERLQPDNTNRYEVEESKKEDNCNLLNTNERLQPEITNRPEPEKSRKEDGVNLLNTNELLIEYINSHYKKRIDDSKPVSYLDKDDMICVPLTAKIEDGQLVYPECLKYSMRPIDLFTDGFGDIFDNADKLEEKFDIDVRMMFSNFIMPKSGRLDNEFFIEVIDTIIEIYGESVIIQRL